MLPFDPRLGGRREDAVEGRHQSFEVKRLQEDVRDSLQVILGIGGQRIPGDEQQPIREGRIQLHNLAGELLAGPVWKFVVIDDEVKGSPPRLFQALPASGVGCLMRGKLTFRQKKVGKASSALGT